MAIEIIPKTKTKKVSFLDILFYFSLLLFLAFLISYFALNVYQKRLESELTNIKKDLEKTPDEKALEEEIFGSEKNIGYQQKIKDFGVLFNAHKLPVNFFNFLEENTHPKVWFSKFNLDLEKNLLEMSGEAQNFEALGQQVLIFKRQDSIKNMNLPMVSLGKDGKVNFDLQLTIDPKIFK